MNYYQLDSKEQDANFIKGESIQCEAAMTEEEFKTGRIKEGDRLVIRLSNGAKYLGEILRFQHEVKNGIASGVLEIKRVNRGN